MFASFLKLTQKAIGRYVDLSEKSPLWVLLGLLLVTLLLSLSIPRLSVQTRIEALLPTHTVSQQSNDEASRRYAGSAPYFLVVQSSDPAFNRRMTDQILAEVKKWPETIWAMNARDPQVFLDHRLLYADEETLGKFTEDVKRYVEFRKCEKMPGCFQLDDEPPQPSFEVLEEQLKSQPEIQSLTALFGENALSQAVQTRADDPEEGRGDLCSKDGKVCVVQVALEQEPTELRFSQGMVKKGEALLARLKPRDAPRDTVMTVAGIYRNLPMSQEALMNDLTRSFGVGILLMVGIILLQFRGSRTLILLLLPLAFGSVWALGVFAWVSPELNLISAAGFIILAGLGIDFGLHLLTHYGAEREMGHEAKQAVRHTLEELVPSLSVAALTTAFGFSALTAAEFRGFAQLGVFATIGIFATLVAALLTFPPLILGLHRVRPREGAFARSWPMPSFLKGGFAPAPARFITITGLVAFAAGLALLPQLRLREDLEPLVEQAADTRTNYRDALPGTSRGAVLLLADDQESLERAAASIRRLYPSGLSGQPAGRAQSSKNATGAPLITLGTFLPGHQEEKLARISELSEAADEAMRFGDEEWKEKIRPWLPLLEVDRPLTAADLPDWVKNSLTERDGTFGTVGITYQDFPGSHAGKMLELTRRLNVLREENPKVRFAASSAILGEVMPLLREDGWKVTALALLGLLVATWIVGRSRRRTTLILSTILVAVAVIAAIMVVFDWRIDFYNMLVFPVVFGMGVDGAIYVVWSVLARLGRPDWQDLPVSARAVFGSTMTTLVMFLSLATSDNGGLRSLGTVGSMALFVTLIANLVWLPAALSWLNSMVNTRREKANKNALLSGPTT